MCMTSVKDIEMQYNGNRCSLSKYDIFVQKRTRISLFVYFVTQLWLWSHLVIIMLPKSMLFAITMGDWKQFPLFGQQSLLF